MVRGLRWIVPSCSDTLRAFADVRKEARDGARDDAFGDLDGCVGVERWVVKDDDVESAGEQEEVEEWVRGAGPNPARIRDVDLRAYEAKERAWANR